MNARPVLAVSNLCVTFGGVPALRNVGLEVPEGSTVALVGRNGAGKTTTLRAIMGLVKTAGGSLHLDGAALGTVPPHHRARLGIGYAPEDRRMIGALSVEENLLLPAQACGWQEAARTAGMERVYALLPELAQIRTRPAGSLSGGQQKMVALGRALLVGRRLLLLDEPFQGLAPALARRYAEALTELRRRDAALSILVTESNPALLQPLAPVHYAIERGEVVSGYGLTV